MESNQAKELIEVLKKIEGQLGAIAKSIGSINSMLPPISATLQQIPSFLNTISSRIK